MYSKVLLIPILAVAIFTAVFVGCEGPEGPQGPTGSPSAFPVYVVAWVKHLPINYYNDKEGMDSTTEAQVNVYNCPTIPSAEINGIRISPSDPFYRGCNPFRFYDGNSSVSRGDSAALLVTYSTSDGAPRTIHASIMLPSQFEIESPGAPYDTISVGDSLVFLWTASRGANAYIADFRLGYAYLDTSGTYQYFEYIASDIVLMDTFVVFSQAKLFPNQEEIDSLDYGYGFFDLWAMNGPTPDEDQGNVAGDAIGFFNGWTYGGEVRLVFRSPNPSACEMAETENPIQKLGEQRTKRMNLRQRQYSELAGN